MKIFKTFFIALVVILGLGALGLGILSKGTVPQGVGHCGRTRRKGEE